MYLLSACSISPQDTFAHDGLPPAMRTLNGHRWSCIEPDYKVCIPDAALRRRMSRVIKMGVAAALRCVELAQVHPDAIITATGLGCIADTEKFLNTVTECELQLNPTPFIQSTFNTAGAQIALLLGCHGYNTTYVHRGFSFESALLDAMLQLDDGDAHCVLAGCFDETTDTGFEIMRRLGYWKNGLDSSDRLFRNCTRGTASGEGATFFMLGSHPPADRPAVRLTQLQCFHATVGGESVGQHVANVLAAAQKTFADIDLLILGNSGDAANDIVCQRLVMECFPETAYCLFKNLCGEYPAASGFALYLASGILATQHIPDGIICSGTIPKRINRILIFNQYQYLYRSLMLCEL